MHQLVLLCTSNKGYHNLLQLVSQGWLDGFYYEPRIDLELLAQYSEGLICLTGAGNFGFLNLHLSVGANEEAERQLQRLVDIFGDRVYVELTDHSVDDGVDLVRRILISLKK